MNWALLIVGLTFAVCMKEIDAGCGQDLVDMGVISPAILSLDGCEDLKEAIAVGPFPVFEVTKKTVSDEAASFVNKALACAGCNTVVEGSTLTGKDVTKLVNSILSTSMKAAWKEVAKERDESNYMLVPPSSSDDYKTEAERKCNLLKEDDVKNKLKELFDKRGAKKQGKDETKDIENLEKQADELINGGDSGGPPANNKGASKAAPGGGGRRLDCDPKTPL